MSVYFEGLLVASQQFEERCGMLMTDGDLKSAVQPQVPSNNQRTNNWSVNTW
jgi:hypothetical protein